MTLFAIRNIAGVYQNQGKYHKALKWYSRALSGAGEALGKGRPVTLSVASGMVDEPQKVGKRGEAPELHRHATASVWSSCSMYPPSIVASGGGCFAYPLQDLCGEGGVTEMERFQGTVTWFSSEHACSIACCY